MCGGFDFLILTWLGLLIAVVFKLVAGLGDVDVDCWLVWALAVWFVIVGLVLAWLLFALGVV